MVVVALRLRSAAPRPRTSFGIATPFEAPLGHRPQLFSAGTTNWARAWRCKIAHTHITLSVAFKVRRVVRPAAVCGVGSKNRKPSRASRKEKRTEEMRRGPNKGKEEKGGISIHFKPGSSPARIATIVHSPSSLHLLNLPCFSPAWMRPVPVRQKHESNRGRVNRQQARETKRDERRGGPWASTL